jgi:hypothetical protein
VYISWIGGWTSIWLYAGRNLQPGVQQACHSHL